ncbi:MAG TPA: hypothetical protein VFA01_02670 [Candidatus Dormibacteraeota bacterium]|nr:hypothetical protein [Candidatus Dormibacteraeota bacterium]
MADVSGGDLIVFVGMLAGVCVAGVGIVRDALADRHRPIVVPADPPEDVSRAA